MNGALFASYLLALTVLMLTPGPDMLFALSCGVRFGARAGFTAACGAAAGEVAHLSAAAVGLAALFRTVPAVYDAVRLAGAVYLIGLGVAALRGGAGTGRADGGHHGMAADQGADATPFPLRRVFARGVVTNLLNPKMALFNIAFLPQFVDASRGHLPVQFLVLGVCFVLWEIAIDGTVGLAAGRLHGRPGPGRRAARCLDALCGAVFIAFGVWFGLIG